MARAGGFCLGLSVWVNSGASDVSVVTSTVPFTKIGSGIVWGNCCKKGISDAFRTCMLIYI